MQNELMTLKEVSQAIHLGATTIYLKLNPKYRQYDPSFPRPVKIGLKATRWFRHEIEAWKEKLANDRNTNNSL